MAVALVVFQHKADPGADAVRVGLGDAKFRGKHVCRAEGRADARGSQQIGVFAHQIR